MRYTFQQTDQIPRPNNKHVDKEIEQKRVLNILGQSITHTATWVNSWTFSRLHEGKHPHSAKMVP